MPDQPQLIVLATATAKPGREYALAEALLEVARPTLAQRGCLGFELLQDAEDPSSITAIERWASVEDHDKHLVGAHVARLMEKFDRLVAAPPKIVSMRPLETPERM